MNYPVKVSTSPDFDQLIAARPELADAVKRGVTFLSVPTPAPLIDMKKIRGEDVAVAAKKPSSKM